MPTYKTPDVYVEELSIFPPSVAEVETAVPAFIGHTEKATRLTTGDLANVPTRITSLLEYQTYFGGAAPVTITNVALDDANNFVSATVNASYYLYDSLRAFFDNGGGPCYIVSVGGYEDDIDSGLFFDGLDAIKAMDEPTMLLFPDAATLSASDLGAVQQAALSQCAKLKDRVAVLDTRSDDALGTAFRNNVGINNLKYGAAYTPWLKVSYNKNLSYEGIRTHITKRGSSVAIDSLTTDTGVRSIITRLETGLTDAGVVRSKLTTLLGGATSINAKFATKLGDYQNTKTVVKLQAVYAFVYDVAGFVDDLLNVSTGVQATEYRTLIGDTIGSTLLAPFTELIANEVQLDGLGAVPAYTPQWSIDPDPSAGAWGGLFTTGAAASAVDLTGAVTDAEKMDRFIRSLTTNFAVINNQVDGIIAAAASYIATYEKTLYDVFPVYKNIVRGIDNSLSVIPPSGAMAGIYAMVDNQRGVWKAPANVSVANVVGPSVNFTTDNTDGLNIDTEAGKSINAIRAFAGKGTLVWGARTLAGNDNEWRYISVRRFFNMVEESVKKSTYWAVFEPNDANTWVKVRGMIENYLTQKWREGALAGATTKDAFFVRCGLGVTMTAEDILEGRMNVEIGMAVVRPAEFIILKFSHKLQTS